MDTLKARICCRDCGREQDVEFISPIVPLVDGSCCASLDEDKKQCTCGCEAFHVLKVN